MTADINGIYRPKPNTVFTAGQQLASIGSDGWLPLTGLPADRIYSIGVKGSHHRNSTLNSRVVLHGGQPVLQDFDWTFKLLEPGDLPDPNNSSTQDCIVNSIDLSMAEARIGTTDPFNNSIADVNYDKVINGNDVSKIVNTLSFKPDDD